MKIMGQHIGTMYLWTILLLALAISFASYVLGQFPTILVFAFVAAVIIDVLIDRFYLEHSPKFPASAIISGLIIGAVAPINAPFLLVLFAVVLAILSKHFLRTKHGNVINPAAFGLLIALFVFAVGDDWWIATSINFYGIAFALTPILAIAAYKAHRLTASFSFVIGMFLPRVLLSLPSLSLQGLLVALLGINFFFAFIMVAEPRTSPSSRRHQAVYGLGVAVTLLVMTSNGIPYSFLLSLLLINIIYAIYRIRKK